MVKTIHIVQTTVMYDVTTIVSIIGLHVVWYMMTMSSFVSFISTHCTCDLSCSDMEDKECLYTELGHGRTRLHPYLLNCQSLNQGLHPHTHALNGGIRGVEPSVLTSPGGGARCLSSNHDGRSTS